MEEREAICPAGQPNTQCSRLEGASTGKVVIVLNGARHCEDCPLRPQCIKDQQKHRTLAVGEHHTILQARRREQQTEAFKQRMKHRNAIEGTQSELVRAHGLRRARYRGLAKANSKTTSSVRPATSSAGFAALPGNCAELEANSSGDTELSPNRLRLGRQAYFSLPLRPIRRQAT